MTQRFGNLCRNAERNRTDDKQSATCHSYEVKSPDCNLSIKGLDCFSKKCN